MSRPVHAIHLYRRCLRSIKLIRDHSQRTTFYEYTRDGFRRNRHLYPGSREACLACNDALEQVKSMEYYQEMQDTKLQDNKNKLLRSKDVTSADSPSRKDLCEPEQTYTEETANAHVVRWLQAQLPHLQKDDASRYAASLNDLGFDSIAFIEEELLEEDLSFMKIAHRRVLLRQLSKIRSREK